MIAVTLVATAVNLSFNVDVVLSYVTMNNIVI